MPKVKIEKVVVSINVFKKYHEQATEICEAEQISFSRYVNTLIESNLRRRGYTKWNNTSSTY